MRSEIEARAGYTIEIAYEMPLRGHVSPSPLDLLACYCTDDVSRLQGYIRKVKARHFLFTLKMLIRDLGQ